MSQENTKPAEYDEDSGPASLYQPFVSMENLLDKLKMLDYEIKYCKAWHQKLLTKHYFAIPTNPGEQFHCFTTLAAWLINMAGVRMEQPQEYDDPNATISTILERVRQDGNTIEFPPSKLKSGCGEPCIRILDYLANSAIKHLNITYSFPQYSNEENEDIDVEEAGLSDDENDTVEWLGAPGGGRTLANTSSNFNDDKDMIDDEFEEEDILDLDALGQRSGQNRQSANMSDIRNKDGSLLLGNDSTAGERLADGAPSNVLESRVDASEWLLEVERVLPRLRVTIRSEAKDWRAHLSQMHRHQSDIESCFKDARSHLARIRDDLTRSLDKIQSREKYMNTQVDPLLSTYREVKDQLSEIKDKYRQASTGITDRSKLLAEVTEELEQVKLDMDERGSSMTDGSPVVRIKRAIQRLKSEMVAMDIRTGVLEHILLRVHLRAREESQKPLFSRHNGPGEANESANYVY